MSVQVALNHRTQYLYDRAVSLGPQVIQLRPAPHCRTPILSYSFDVIPSEHDMRWQLDPHSNYLARLLFPNKTTEFVVDVNLIAELSPVNPFDFFLEPGVEDYPFAYQPELAKDLEPYRSVGGAGPLLRAFLDGVSRLVQAPGQERPRLFGAGLDALAVVVDPEGIDIVLTEPGDREPRIDPARRAGRDR